MCVRVIHRYWSGPDEPDIDGPAWHDSDLPADIAAWCDSRMGQVLDLDGPRHRSNMVRWWLLAEHGGLWLDHDAVLHGTPPVGAWVGALGQHACAAAIALPPDHPLAWAMLHEIDQQPVSDRPCPQVSGSYLLTRLANQLGVRFEQIPGPGQPATWISHEWATSTLRKAA